MRQEKETWAADFRPLPKPAEQTETHYLGLVVALPKGDPLVYLPVEYTPTVNDLADLLADAMRRPLTGSARRPERIHLRDNPRWEELFPHLVRLPVYRWHRAVVVPRGHPLVRVHFPRCYVDVNREPWELDPAMFEDELPDFARGRTARVAAGLGTIARVVAEGRPIYARKLTFAEAKGRAIERFESAYLSALLKRCGGNLSKASREGDVARHHLRELLKKRGLYGIGD